MWISSWNVPQGVILEKKLEEGFKDTGRIETCGNSHYNVLARGNEVVLYNAKTDVAITPGKVSKIGGK